ncbi:hypothetical protein [Meiothermus rufus]|uniref:hypothetical protein n=1 Tax=Meiothermus rufus TaxID=604332 RepID=UPI000415656F|nr:hypothetical protein [Meiothermus rufus]
MFYWKFSDGTVIHSHAWVEGHSPFAQHLRQELLSLVYGCGPLVWLSPGVHAIKLEPLSDELLALWLEQEARCYDLSLVETDFVANQPLLEGTAS